eukprot:GFUD01044417.1.p1 GENE.GFUD01044417.1~~GFUD01044417.1.p1  ORF type:complete len:252 (+),score=82.36 GFUD01044417.1:274-1029(+)
MEQGTRRVTRALLTSDHKMSKKNRNKKKVKFDDHSSKEEMKNLSVASDEGIDMTFSPLRPSLSIPSTIIKPHHPLSHSWTFWYSAGNRHLSWKKNQIKISTVTSIEEFWLTYTQVQPASCLNTGHTFSVFRADILPDWEDASNMGGGRWMLNCAKTERQEMLDSRWLEVLFMMMGEHVQKEAAKLVTGAEVCVRKKGDRLEVWVGDVSSMSGVVEVGRTVRRKLDVDPSNKMTFSVHKEEREGCVGPRLMM